MRKIILFLTSFIFVFCIMPSARAWLCKKEFMVSIKMDDEWYKKEELRKIKEDILLAENSKYITKEAKPLISAKPFPCKKGENCDPVKNCQVERHPENFKDIEYSMKIDSGITIAKSYCSVIGKCIGYNDFLHSKEVTAAEDRLIDIKKNNAIFYHYFYSDKSDAYEPLFNITNLNSGYELYLDDVPHFSLDEKVIIEVRSIEKDDSKVNFPTGYNINIYEINEVGEYRRIEGPELDPDGSEKVISTFLSRNPECGETPHFHSWKSDREVRLSMMPPNESSQGKIVVLFYDDKLKKWSCKDDVLVRDKCEEYYLPGSNEYSSNLSLKQISNCH